MKKLLITGFDPFGGESINPSWEAVKLLPQQIGDIELIKLELPTVFGTAAQRVIETAETCGADMILCVGQAGERQFVTPEFVGINLRYARIADNNGCIIHDSPIVENGPAAYFSTLPVREMSNVEHAAASYSAGTFVCNDVLYSVLHHFSSTNVCAAFVHVPFLPEQAKNQYPSMELSTIVQTLESMIRVLSEG